MLKLSNIYENVSTGFLIKDIADTLNKRYERTVGTISNGIDVKEASVDFAAVVKRFEEVDSREPAWTGWQRVKFDYLSILTSLLPYLCHELLTHPV